MQDDSFSYSYSIYFSIDWPKAYFAVTQQAVDTGLSLPASHKWTPVKEAF